jgi:hypothetical protein
MSAIPITLTPVPVPVGVQATDINALLQIIASYTSASIKTNVSFFAQFSAVPTKFVTSLIYNTSNNLFYGWNSGSASYQPITPYQPGQVIQSFSSGDIPQQGLFVLNGRLISAIPNISQNQSSVLQTLFGISGSLPTVTPLQALGGLPQKGSFSTINNPAVAPPSGQLGGLTFSSPPAQTEVQALAQNTEVLDESAIGLQAALAASLTASEQMLDALLATSGPTMTAFVFAGFP